MEIYETGLDPELEHGIQNPNPEPDVDRFGRAFLLEADF